MWMKCYLVNKLSKSPNNLLALEGTFRLWLLHKHTHTHFSTPPKNSWLQFCPKAGSLWRIKETFWYSNTGDAVCLSHRKLKSEKSEIGQANCEIYLDKVVLSQPVGEMGPLVCVQGSVHVPTHHWGGRLLFNMVKKPKNIPLQSHSSRISPNTHKRQMETLYLCTSFACL